MRKATDPITDELVRASKIAWAAELKAEELQAEVKRLRAWLDHIAMSGSVHPSWLVADAKKALAGEQLDPPWYCPHQEHSTGECGPMCECAERMRNGTYGAYVHQD